VFLLQGMGRRRWRVSTQADLALRPRLPLRILRHFRSEHEWVVNAGDMLYLPPRYAHDGVALDPCMTYSIGFRAPGSSELAAAWLDHLRDHLPETIAGYADPALRMTSTPARIGPDMTRQCRRLVRVCLPGAIMPEAEFARFLGTWLTEPKPHIFFVPPEAPLGQRRFAACARRRGLALDPCTQMLYDGARVFTNGECETPAGAAQVVVRRLADRRALDGREVPVPVPSLFFAWYRAGYLHLKGTG
jgi:50S ribosomal protein L16 3-hydroxylase